MEPANGEGRASVSAVDSDESLSIYQSWSDFPGAPVSSALPSDPRGVLEPFVGMLITHGRVAYCLGTAVSLGLSVCERNSLKHTDLPQHRSEFVQKEVGKKPRLLRSAWGGLREGEGGNFSLSVITVFLLGVG